MGLFERQHFLDLRSFGAIGFQDAPNGLWLGKQGYRPRTQLLQRIVEHALAKGVTIMGITTEDDAVVPGSPEDRFGFLGSEAMELPKGYWRDSITNNIFAVGKTEEGRPTEHVLYLVNAQTVGALHRGVDWNGLKLHVVGRNRLPRYASLKDQAQQAHDEGLVTFLMNVGVSDAAEAAADEVFHLCTGIIGHDANNTFHPLWRVLPKVGPAIGKYTTDANARAVIYAAERKKPWIAVSSSHWMSQIGAAGITCDRSELPVTPHEPTFLADLARLITDRDYGYNLGYNSNRRVAQFGHWLQTFGSAPDRFNGDRESSYNRPRQL